MDGMRLNEGNYAEAKRKMTWQNKRLQLLVKEFGIAKKLREFCYTEGVNIELLIVQKEAVQKFFRQLLDGLGLDDLTVLSMILVAQKELSYEQYSEYVGDHIKTLEELVQNTYTYDLKYHRPMDISHIKRKATTLKLIAKQNIFNDYKLTLLYRRIQEETRLKKSATALLNSLERESKEDTLTREIVEAASAYACDMNFELQDYYTYVNDCELEKSPIDEYFIEHCRDLIIKEYGGCAKCHQEDTKESPLRLVHLWKPKAECGTLAMKSKKGYYVNNCIPLCMSCNTERARLSLFLMFDQDEMIHLLNKSKKTDCLIHEKMLGFDDKYFPQRKKNKRVL